MTLQECITQHHAARPIDAGVGVLTPLGHAVVAVHRLARQLRFLDQADRAYVVRMIAVELGEAHHA